MTFSPSARLDFQLEFLRKNLEQQQRLAYFPIDITYTIHENQFYNFAFCGQFTQESRVNKNK